jgi:hypothetical protein
VHREAVWQWNNTGEIYVWRYLEASRGWIGHHMTADREGCRFLLGLIGIFRNLESGGWRKFALAEVTKEQSGVPIHGKKTISLRRLELVFRPELEKDHFVELETEEEVVFEMGRARLDEFEKGIKDIARGDGDWAMSGDGARLWFWW